RRGQDDDLSGHGALREHCTGSGYAQSRMARAGQSWRFGAIAAGFGVTVAVLVHVGLAPKAPHSRPRVHPVASWQAPTPRHVVVGDLFLARPRAELAASASAPAVVIAPVPLQPPSLEAAPVASIVRAEPSATAEAVREALPLAIQSQPRSLPLVALAAWSKPGLCSSSPEAAAARDTITRSFRVWDGAERGKFYLDPRLPADAELPILGYLDQADNEISTRLGLRPARPIVFVYFDQQLMKAAACINEDAVAFYDGALHIVATRSDVLQSVLHEYTHHALFSSGMVGPAWAQEGIAMNIAHETWWRDPKLLQALLSNGFDQEDMDRSIPYKLPPQQAVAFYVQSAALVECVLRKRRWGLKELFAALRAGADVSGGTLTYDLPELAQSSFLRECLAN
ncbi:MAG TPA: hypothetical protein VF294_12610, partial [Polyangiaceae bacterium]